MTRILIAEDDADLRSFVRTALEEHGYETDEANNGVEALVRLQQHRPDVVILDLVMPVVDGWTFLERAGRTPEMAAIPIIVVSADPSLYDSTARHPSVRGVLSKPFAVDQLLHHVRRVTAGSPA